MDACVRSTLWNENSLVFTTPHSLCIFLFHYYTIGSLLASIGDCLVASRLGRFSFLHKFQPGPWSIALSTFFKDPTQNKQMSVATLPDTAASTASAPQGGGPQQQQQELHHAAAASQESQQPLPKKEERRTVLAETEKVTIAEEDQATTTTTTNHHLVPQEKESITHSTTTIHPEDHPTKNTNTCTPSLAVTIKTTATINCTSPSMDDKHSDDKTKETVSQEHHTPLETKEKEKEEKETSNIVEESCTENCASTSNHHKDDQRATITPSPSLTVMTSSSDNKRESVSRENTEPPFQEPEQEHKNHQQEEEEESCRLSSPESVSRETTEPPFQESEPKDKNHHEEEEEEKDSCRRRLSPSPPEDKGGPSQPTKLDTTSTTPKPPSESNATEEKEDEKKNEEEPCNKDARSTTTNTNHQNDMDATPTISLDSTTTTTTTPPGTNPPTLPSECKPEEKEPCSTNQTSTTGTTTTIHQPQKEDDSSTPTTLDSNPATSAPPQQQQHLLDQKQQQTTPIPTKSTGKHKTGGKSTTPTTATTKTNPSRGDIVARKRVAFSHKKTFVLQDQIQETDILLGREGNYKQQGNHTFRHLIQAFRDHYHHPHLTRTDKTILTRHIVQLLQTDYQARFLKRLDEDDSRRILSLWKLDKTKNKARAMSVWCEIPTLEAREKVSHALRNAKPKQGIAEGAPLISLDDYSVLAQHAEAAVARPPPLTTTNNNTIQNRSRPVPKLKLKPSSSSSKSAITKKKKKRTTTSAVSSTKKSTGKPSNDPPPRKKVPPSSNSRKLFRQTSVLGQRSLQPKRRCKQPKTEPEEPEKTQTKATTTKKKLKKEEGRGQKRTRSPRDMPPPPAKRPTTTKRQDPPLPLTTTLSESLSGGRSLEEDSAFLSLAVEQHSILRSILSENSRSRQAAVISPLHTEQDKLAEVAEEPTTTRTILEPRMASLDESDHEETQESTHILDAEPYVWNDDWNHDPTASYESPFVCWDMDSPESVGIEEDDEESVVWNFSFKGGK